MLVPRDDMCSQTVRDGMGWNFGRTDLRISASKAKFDARADGDVHLAVRRPKPRKIRERKFFDPKISRNNFFASERNYLRIVRNAFGQIFAAKSPANPVANGVSVFLDQAIHRSIHMIDRSKKLKNYQKTAEKSKNVHVLENSKNARFFSAQGRAGPEAPRRGRGRGRGRGRHLTSWTRR